MNSAKVNKVGKYAFRRIRSLCASAIVLSVMNLLGISPTTAAQASPSTSAAANDVIVQGALPLTRMMEVDFVDLYAWFLRLSLNAGERAAVQGQANSLLESIWRKNDYKSMQAIKGLTDAYCQLRSFPEDQQRLFRLQFAPSVLQQLSMKSKDRQWNQARELMLRKYAADHPLIAPNVPFTYEMVAEFLDLTNFMDAVSGGTTESTMTPEQKAVAVNTIVTAYPLLAAQPQSWLGLYIQNSPYLNASVRFAWPSLSPAQKAQALAAWAQFMDCIAHNGSSAQQLSAYSGQTNYSLPTDSTAFAEQMVNKTYMDNMLINNVGNAMMGATPQF